MSKSQSRAMHSAFAFGAARGILIDRRCDTYPPRPELRVRTSSSGKKSVWYSNQSSQESTRLFSLMYSGVPPLGGNSPTSYLGIRFARLSSGLLCCGGVCMCVGTGY